MFREGSITEEEEEREEGALALADFLIGRENRSRSKVINLGNSRPSRALLMLFREKMLPKLPATTRGSFLARMAVAACSLELPQPML